MKAIEAMSLVYLGIWISLMSFKSAPPHKEIVCEFLFKWISWTAHRISERDVSESAKGISAYVLTSPKVIGGGLRVHKFSDLGVLWNASRLRSIHSKNLRGGGVVARKVEASASLRNAYRPGSFGSTQTRHSFGFEESPTCRTETLENDGRRRSTGI